MDKRWRNLAVLLLVVLIAVIACIFLPLSPPVLTADNVAADLDGILETSGTDAVNIKSLDVVYFSGNDLVAEFSEAKSGQIANQLLAYKASLPEKVSPAELEKAEKVVKMYLDAIAIIEAKRGLFEETEALLADDRERTCADSAMFENLRVKAENIFLDASNLYLDDADYLLDYNTDSLLLNVNIDNEAEWLDYYQINDELLKELCAEEIA